MSVVDSMTIRPLRDTDHPAIRSMADRLASGVAPWRKVNAVCQAVEGWVEDALHTADPHTSPVFVAEEDGVVCGFISGGTREHWTGEIDAYISELVVDDGHVRHGVGRALVTELEKWARQHGYRRITLETGYGNQEAREFYHKLGFEVEEVVLTHQLS